MSVNKLKDGRWICQYQINGKTKRVYFGRGPDAEAKARKHQKELPIRGYTGRPKAEIQYKNRPVSERIVTERLAFYLRIALGGDYVETEIRTRSGLIDIVTPFEIIEVKRYDEWKNGLGQVIAYGVYAKGKKLRLHLFNKEEYSGKGIKDDWFTLVEICNVCAMQNVYLSFDEPSIYRKLTVMPGRRVKPEFLVYPIQIGCSVPEQSIIPSNQLELHFEKFFKIGQGQEIQKLNKPLGRPPAEATIKVDSEFWKKVWEKSGKRRRKEVLESIKLTNETPSDAPKPPVS
jgi:hypothetical protein